jgi:hypothetical protein
VLAYMGGEPLLRPDFIHRITYYAAKKDFWIYLPTNARLLRTDVIDRLADAGMSTFNIAVDAVDLKPGLPKALVPIRKQFDYLVRKQYGYGYSVFLNINICRNNLDDVRQLTQIAHDNGIATDYHINESPLLEQDEHFKHGGDNVTYITQDDWPAPEVADSQAGKEFGNNGQCNPTYFTVGNLVRYLQKLEQQGLTRQQIIDNYVFFTAGSCGPCRFGMHEAEYRFALQNAGFEGFRVLLFQQTDGIKAASGELGLKFSVDFGMGMLNALNLGDVINELVYQVRPFEVTKGETDRVIHESVKTLTDTLRDRKRWHIVDAAPQWARPYLEKHKKLEGIGCTLGKIGHNLYGKEYVGALHACRDSINAIEMDRMRVKPVIKITGEFWAQTTEGDGNFNMFAFLEKERAQVLVEPIATWIAYMMYVAKEGAKARADAEAPYRDPKWYEVKKHLANEL